MRGDATSPQHFSSTNVESSLSFSRITPFLGVFKSGKQPPDHEADRDPEESEMKVLDCTEEEVRVLTSVLLCLSLTPPPLPPLQLHQWLEVRVCGAYVRVCVLCVFFWWRGSRCQFRHHPTHPLHISHSPQHTYSPSIPGGPFFCCRGVGGTERSTQVSTA